MLKRLEIKNKKQKKGIVKSINHTIL